jgi:hypothetical protein
MLNKLYSQSRVPTQQWNGNELGFLTANEFQFQTSFIENRNLSQLLSYDVNNETKHLFMPTVTDKTLSDGSIQSNPIIIGNTVDNLEHIFPVKAS